MMKRKLFLVTAALCSIAAMATNWTIVINNAPESALWQINGKTVKKTDALALPPDQIDTVAVYTADEAPADVKGGSTANGYVSVYTKVQQISGETKTTQFPGGKEALDAFLAAKLVYPEVDKPNNINGYVVVKFVVQSDGKIISPEISRSLSEACDAEALRLVQIMPAWEPGTVGGQAVVSMYQLPILFKCPKTKKR